VIEKNKNIKIKDDDVKLRNSEVRTAVKNSDNKKINITF